MKKKLKLPKAQAGKIYTQSNTFATDGRMDNAMSPQNELDASESMNPYYNPNQWAARKNIVGEGEAQVAYTGKKPNFWDSPLTLNWSHILGSQVIQGSAMALSNGDANSYQNATLRYNQQKSPLNWLPPNPNSSQQALYGMQEGGIVDDYIKDFIFGEETKQAETPKKKNSDTKSIVTQSDIEQFQVDESQDIVAPRRSRRGDAMEEDGTVKQIDPRVAAATAELLAKFPGLNVTSGIRSWGDKDAHPKGRAVDVAGESKLMTEAWKYYKENIVPKYGFNEALPLNHGTGPHVHVGYYQKGGAAPITVSNPNDARLKAYQDSLKAYNSGLYKAEVYKDYPITQTHVPIQPNEDYLDGSTVDKKIKPIDAYQINLGSTIPIYKKPVQPVVYHKDNRQVLNGAPKELVDAYKRIMHINKIVDGKFVPEYYDEINNIYRVFDKYKVPNEKLSPEETRYDFEWIERKMRQQVAPQPPAHRASFTKGILNPQDPQSFSAPLAGARPNISDTQQPATEYSYSYRDNKGEQATKYFNDWNTWNSFVKEQPFIDAPTNVAKTYGHATGHYLKQQMGGAIGAMRAGQFANLTQNVKDEATPTNIEDERAFFMNYIKSPKYLERLKNQGYKYPHLTIDDRLKNVKATTVTDLQGMDSFYSGPDNAVVIDRKFNKENGFPLATVEAHEMGHAAGDIGIKSKQMGKHIELNQKDKQALYKRNNLLDGLYGHDSMPHEMKADIDTLRFFLKRDHIYDAGTEDFNKNLLQKVKQKYMNDPVINRLFQNVTSEDDLIWLMNNIAQTDSQESNPYAKEGGIHINPEHKGRFTAWAKSHGMSVSEAASHVMANKEKYGSGIVKMANFAKNFAQEGGELHLGGSTHGEMTPSMAKKILKDDEVKGHKLTAHQKHYFKHIADGKVSFVGGAHMKKQDGGLINSTGYTEGSQTENNPVNVIPSGGITMANVYSPIVAVPMKGGKAQEPVVMKPNEDHVFDADHTIEFRAGGTYDLSKEQIEMLKKLGYDIEIM